MEQQDAGTPRDAGPQAADTETKKLPTKAHLLCGWPLLLVAVGGAIGGALGGLAYGVNIAVYKSKMPVFAKVILNLVTGLLAVGIWVVISMAVSSRLG